MTGLSDILNIDLTKYNDETLTAYYDKLDEYRKEIERILRHRKNVEKFDKMTNKEKADFINISLDMMDDFPKDYRLTEEHFKNGSFYGIKTEDIVRRPERAFGNERIRHLFSFAAAICNESKYHLALKDLSTFGPYASIVLLDNNKDRIYTIKLHGEEDKEFKVYTIEVSTKPLIGSNSFTQSTFINPDIECSNINERRLAHSMSFPDGRYIIYDDTVKLVVKYMDDIINDIKVLVNKRLEEL